MAHEFGSTYIYGACEIQDGEYTRILFALAALALFSVGAQASVVTVQSVSCLRSSPPQDVEGPFGTQEQYCAYKSGVPGNGKDDELFPILTGLDLLYKAETVDPDDNNDQLSPTPADEDGVYKNSYSTEFGWLSTGDEYSKAKITYDGLPAPAISECKTGTCYLMAKGGLGIDPAAYLFASALTGWDGMMPIEMKGFWALGPGSISHVAIYGTISAVPVPAAFWLFGTALLGFIGLSRSGRI